MRNPEVSVLSLAVLPALLLNAAAPAQVLDATSFQPRNDAGLGSIKRSFNATALTRIPGLSCNAPNDEVACALTSAIWHKGRFWVFGREGWASPRELGGKSYVFEWTGDGVFVATHELPLPLDPEDDFWGASGRADTPVESRDLATDEFVGGEAIFLGTEEGIYTFRYDLATGKWEMFDQVVTANGTVTIKQPVRGPGLKALRVLGTPELPADPAGVAPTYNGQGEGFMGVAYDPNGNGGDGSFFVGADDGFGVGSFRAHFDQSGDMRPYFNVAGEGWLSWDEPNLKPILEIDLEGNILRTVVNNPDTDPMSPTFGEPLGGWWCVGGIEIDPLSGNLWVLCDADENIIEVDINTGVPTGAKFAQPIPSPNRQGGLTGIPKGDPGSYPGFWDMVAFTNVAGDDFFTTVRMHQYPVLSGLTEASLQASVNALPPGAPPPIVYTNQDTINIHLNPNGQPAAPALLMFDFNDDVDTDASTSLFHGPLPELRVHHTFSVPTASGSSIQTTFATGQTLNLDLPALGIPVNTGDQIRTQAIYFDPRSQYSPGLMVSNEVWFAGVGINQVLVEASGPNSANADRSSGFFRVRWLSGPDIVSVKLSFQGSQSNGAAFADARFDTDEINMSDIFGMGNSTSPGCMGTYRNGSDATTGLIYDALNTIVGLNSAICDYWERQGAVWQSGFVGSVNVFNSDSFANIQFGFTDFGLDGAGNPASGEEIFEFDCDTDGNLFAKDGGGHVGMVVEVILSDGTILEGELLPDSGDSMRTFIAW